MGVRLARTTNVTNADNNAALTDIGPTTRAMIRRAGSALKAVSTLAACSTLVIDIFGAAWKARRSTQAIEKALADVARSAHAAGENIFAGVVAAAEAGCTHGEICGVLRRELGFGHPMVSV